MDPYTEIREALKKKNKTITWLAEKIGTSQQSLSRNLNDQNLSLEKYLMIVEMLDLRANYERRIEDLENTILQQKVKLRLNHIAWATVIRFELIIEEDLNSILEMLEPGSSKFNYEEYSQPAHDLSQTSFDIERLLFIRKLLAELELKGSSNILTP